MSDLAIPEFASAPQVGTNSRRVYRRVRADILACRRLPGSKLNIAALAAELDVSLGAVREALSMLQSEALVVSEPQRGYTVSPVSPKELDDITEARIGIETMCLKGSIARGDLTWESGLVAAFHRLTRLSQADDGHDLHLNEDWSLAHHEFHARLASACGNDWLLRLRAMLYQQSERYRRLSVPLATAQRDVQGEHRAIFEAVLARDTGRAVTLLESHLRLTASIVRASIKLSPP
ncbi:MAG: FCD domain-containing protein [Proteobacteria bacterium]|nr:FCD domain-containing protein [Pseudomonadota bacterium]